MVLEEDRRTVAAQSWPFKSDVTLESRAGRLGKKVAISQWNCGKWRSCTSAVLQIGGSRVGRAEGRPDSRLFLHGRKGALCFRKRGMPGAVGRLHWMRATRNFRSSFRGCHMPRRGFALLPDPTPDSASMSRGKDVEVVVNVEFSASEPGAETRSSV